MIGYRMPIFEEGCSLTKEMMNQLKEFPLEYVKYTVNDYADGILCGGHFTGDRKELVLHRTLVKYQDSLVFIPDDTRICLRDTTQMQAIKLVLADLENCQEYEQIQVELEADTVLEKNDNTIELARVQLQNGAKLRMQYVDFFDMNTHFDTWNLIYSQWSAYQDASLHPEILRLFYQEAKDCHGKDAVDYAFLMQIGNLQGRTCERDLINFYLNEKLQKKVDNRTNLQMYQDLCLALKTMKKVKRVKTEVKVNSRMIVD